MPTAKSLSERRAERDAAAARKSAARREARAARKAVVRHSKTAEGKLEAHLAKLIKKHYPHWRKPAPASKGIPPLLRPFGVLEYAQERAEIARATLARAAAELADCDAYRGSASTRSGRQARSETKRVRAFLAAEVRSAQKLVAAAEAVIEREIARLRHAGHLPTY